LPHAALLERIEDKGKALKKIKDALDACERNHAGNRALVDHVRRMKTALATEVQRIKNAIDALTLASILQDAGQLRVFRDYCDHQQHNPEPIVFLGLVGRKSGDELFRIFIPPGAPKELNLVDNAGAAVVRRLTVNHNDANAWAEAKRLVIDMVELNELPRFKAYYKGKL
jgi:hypothetical protein